MTTNNDVVATEDAGGTSEMVDELDDFFNDVEEVTKNTLLANNKKAQEEENELAASSSDRITDEQHHHRHPQHPQPPVAATSTSIQHHKKHLGTPELQITRLLQDNYKWKNLNPFHVLDIPHTSTKEDIGRRYKALSLLLHPDKNRNNMDRAQEAYDEVLKAKAALDDDNKANHVRQLIEQGMIRGQSDWDKQAKTIQRNNHSDDSLQEYQKRAIMKIFAQIEQQRREIEQRERSYEQRERQKEQEEIEKGQKSRKFDKDWKQEERVEKRVGNWRDFAHQKKKQTKI